MEPIVLFFFIFKKLNKNKKAGPLKTRTKEGLEIVLTVSF